ncbi:hypothetical protein UCDDA912_g04904 [Diaporthe ampelina]|uniref:Uncharacterized protein n=1 Tax=Diaporthe ampelina TaxID=1214573 RepID=A0A0G2FM42_9PEZI|nr:hypothetical protein UCDDA912_g04904 [Diaporthe ampelina]
MSATTQVSSSTALGVSGPTLSLTGAGEQKPTRPLTRDEAVGFEVDSPDTWADFHKRRAHPLRRLGRPALPPMRRPCAPSPPPPPTEFIGLVTRVGPKVTLHKLDTYGAVWPDTAHVTKGGYSSHIRVHEHYFFPVPAGLPTAAAGAHDVGVGGLGHLAVMLARAMGADEVWAFMLDRSLDADARGLGATGVIVMGDEGVQGGGAHRHTFDLILNSASSSVNCAPFLPLLGVHGRWISVSMPAREDRGTEVSTWTKIENGCLIGASHLGSRQEALEMLRLAADKGVRDVGRGRHQQGGAQGRDREVSQE